MTLKVAVTSMLCRQDFKTCFSGDYLGIKPSPPPLLPSPPLSFPPLPLFQAYVLTLSSFSFARVLDIRVETLGDNHVNVGMVYRNLGTLEYTEEKFDLALDYYTKSLKIYQVNSNILL